MINPDMYSKNKPESIRSVLIKKFSKNNYERPIQRAMKQNRRSFHVEVPPVFIMLFLHMTKSIA